MLRDAKTLEHAERSDALLDIAYVDLIQPAQFVPCRFEFLGQEFAESVLRMRGKPNAAPGADKRVLFGDERQPTAAVARLRIDDDAAFRNPMVRESQSWKIHETFFNFPVARM